MRVSWDGFHVEGNGTGASSNPTKMKFVLWRCRVPPRVSRDNAAWTWEDGIDVEAAILDMERLQRPVSSLWASARTYRTSLSKGDCVRM